MSDGCLPPGLLRGFLFPGWLSAASSAFALAAVALPAGGGLQQLGLKTKATFLDVRNESRTL